MLTTNTTASAIAILITTLIISGCADPIEATPITEAAPIIEATPTIEATPIMDVTTNPVVNTSVPTHTEYDCVNTTEQDILVKICEFEDAPYAVNFDGKQSRLTVFSNDELIYEEIIETRMATVSFKDMNGDDTKDILINHVYDVRSNEHFYLYLINRDEYASPKTTLSKVTGFTGIKNPELIYANGGQPYIQAYAVSGRQYVRFYKIDSDNNVCSLGGIDDVQNIDVDADAFLKDSDKGQCEHVD